MMQFRGGTARAFTIIELLVVIAIIGILSSVMLVSLSSFRTNAKVAKVKDQLKDIQLGFQVFENQYGDYPPLPVHTDFCNMCAYWPPSAIYANGNWQTDIIDQMVSAKILDTTYGADPWGRPYLYDKNFQMGELTCDAHSPLCSMGPDGILQTPNCQTSTPVVNGDDICVFLD